MTLTTPRTTTTSRDPTATTHANEVRLLGRLAAEPAMREMPSGDVVVTFRLVVARGRPARAATRAGVRVPTVDTIDCAAWTRSTQRGVRSCRPGDLLEVRGALRRRFWRSPQGPSSRSEVEVSSVRRTAPAER